uniref:F-box domain-containing protein n=1 Tax=Heterorhabditis bacteriophora TaxID=37862 RepID=A0A1I7X674_HETBA
MDVVTEGSPTKNSESLEVNCKSNLQKPSDEQVKGSASSFDRIPNEILHKIFDCLELEERIVAEQVCSRWHSVLSGGGCPLEDVVVFNIFEKPVWDNTVSKNASSQMKSVDVFTYSASHILVYLHERLPCLEALTMRPHSSAFFWSGLDLPSFPAFSNLTTLIIDNYNLRKFDFHLESIFIRFINLFLLVQTLRLCQLCPLHESFVTQARDKPLLNLKMLKLDLCYGKLTCIVRDFISINSCLSILSLNVLCQLDTLSEVCYVADLLHRRRVGLHLAILQNYSENNDKEYSCASLQVPAALFSVMTKFEASFVEDVAVFHAFLMAAPLKILREVKLVECCAVDNEVITSLAKNAPLLRKLTLKKCENTTEAGILHFVLGLSTRLSKDLQVTWVRDRRFARPASFYLELVHTHKEMLKGKRMKFFTKTFSETDDGEHIIISDREKGKSLMIRDYSEQQTYRIVGVVIPYSGEECTSESDDQSEEIHTDNYVDQLTVEQVKIT